jgi:type I restriction enzyme, S subunit
VSFPRYPIYQDTGLTWFKEAPEHWTVIAPKRVMHSCSGGTLIKGECASEPEDGLFPAFSASGQDVWVGSADYATPGIVLSAVGARCGKTFKANGEWSVVANTHCLFPEYGQSRDFFWYLTNREDWWEVGGTAQPFVKVKETLGRPWCLPPTSEQTSIASFLDRETAKIDALIAEQQRLIELLQEKRQAVISHAVTKGLNPNAPMKDSGVEWLGEVPEHWEVKKIKHLARSISKGTTPSTIGEDFTESGIRFLKAENITPSGITIFPEFFISAETHATLSRSALLGSEVLVVIAGATTGKSAVLQEDICPANTNQAVSFIRTENQLTSCWINNWLSLDATQRRIALDSVQSAQPNLSMEDLGNLPIAVPPGNEMLEIVSSCDMQIDITQSIISASRKLIELMTERRSALIVAAVTGQIDVRGLVEAEASKQ